jgi:hypothetical protein
MQQAKGIFPLAARYSLKAPQGRHPHHVHPVKGARVFSLSAMSVFAWRRVEMCVDQQGLSQPRIRILMAVIQKRLTYLRVPRKDVN